MYKKYMRKLEVMVDLDYYHDGLIWINTGYNCSGQKNNDAETADFMKINPIYILLFYIRMVEYEIKNIKDIYLIVKKMLKKMLKKL